MRAQEQIDVLVEGVSSDMMAQILDYIYTRKIDVNHGNVRQLLETSDLLSVEAIIELCCQFHKDRMDLDNCFRILRLASKFQSCADLESDARHFVLSAFVHLSQQSKELLELPVGELQAIIGADALNVKDEKVVWNCVLRWIDHDAENRKGQIAELLKNVRLGLIEKEFLQEIRSHPYVKENETWRPVIYETLDFVLDPSIVSENAREFLTPKYESKRIPFDILFVIGGSAPGISTDSMETYDAMADQWLKIEEGDQTGPRTRHGVAAVGFNIYVIGGFHDEKSLDSVRCFNAVTKTWTDVEHMIDCRADFSVAVLGDVVYAIGGCNDNDRLYAAERYDHRTNKWSRIASPDTQRTHASATALNGKVYVVGGFNGTAYLASAEVYDPQKNGWTKISPMPSPRRGLCCVAFQGSVYAVGGFREESRSTSTGEKYDPETNTWTYIPHLSHPRGNFVLQVIGDAIYAIGGIHDKTPIRQVERFDGGRHEWEKLADMTTPLRDGVSACVVERLPNVGDYIHKRKHQLVEEDGQGIEAKSDAPLTPKGDGQEEQREDQDLDEH